MKDQTEPAAIDGTTIARRWRASFTRRWHANADLCDTDDPVSGHQCRVALLMLAFEPEVSREALIAALTHDQGEMEIGDMAAPFKVSNPEVAVTINTAETWKRHEQGLPDCDLPIYEVTLIKFCDRLDAYLWMLRHRPQLEGRVDWQDHAKHLMHLEDLLAARSVQEGRCFDAGRVEGLLDEMRG